MKALTYRNTKTNNRIWSEQVHETHPRGFAYVTNTHFVHLYGWDAGFWTLHPRMAIVQEIEGELRDWVEREFGAQEVSETSLDVGATVSAVWRPGLYFDDHFLQAIGNSEKEFSSAGQALRLLLERLDELLLYIEPSQGGLASYGHKSRELLILACTEVENQWRRLLTLANYRNAVGRHLTTTDYVKLAPKLYLREFQFTLKPYDMPEPFCPFSNWDNANPTRSIQWYDAYNKTKHDREEQFSQASLTNCLFAVTANLALFCSRFGPFMLLNESGRLSSLVNQHFKIELTGCDVRDFYVPKIKVPENLRGIRIFDAARNFDVWDTNPLIV